MVLEPLLVTHRDLFTMTGYTQCAGTTAEEPGLGLVVHTGDALELLSALILKTMWRSLGQWAVDVGEPLGRGMAYDPCFSNPVPIIPINLCE